LYWVGEYHVRGFIFVVDHDDIFYRSHCQQAPLQEQQRRGYPQSEYLYGYEEEEEEEGLASRSWKLFKQFVKRKSSKKVKPTDLSAIVT
jgi:hypothetical protein